MRTIGKIVSLLSSALIFAPVLADSVNLTPPTSIVGTNLQNITIATASKAIMQIAIIVAFALAFAYFIWGAIDWIKSGGGKEDVGKAQGKITAAAIGMVVVLLAWAALTFVGQLVGVTNPTQGLTIPPLY